MENTSNIDINEAKNVQHFSNKDTSKPKSDQDNVQKIEGLTHIDKDKADSDDESVQIINFSMTFSPYKSDLHREICDEISRFEKERKRADALRKWKWEEVILLEIEEDEALEDELLDSVLSIIPDTKTSSLSFQSPYRVFELRDESDDDDVPTCL